MIITIYGFLCIHKGFLCNPNITKWSYIFNLAFIFTKHNPRLFAVCNINKISHGETYGIENKSSTFTFRNKVSQQCLYRYSSTTATVRVIKNINFTLHRYSSAFSRHTIIHVVRTPVTPLLLSSIPNIEILESQIINTIVTYITVIVQSSVIQQS